MSLYRKCPQARVADLIQELNGDENDVLGQNSTETQTARRKVPLLLDRSGTLETFFRYGSSRQLRVDQLVMKSVIQQSTGSDQSSELLNIPELLRTHYISACKYGGTCVYNFGRAFPSKWRSEYCKSAQNGPNSDKILFDPLIVFDAEKNRKRDWFKKLLSSSIEDMDDMGNEEIYPKEDMYTALLMMLPDEESEEFKGKSEEEVDKVITKIIDDARTALGMDVFDLLEVVVVG